MLNLKTLELNGTERRHQSLSMQFEVRHNVGALPTTLEGAFDVQIDQSTQLVTAKLTLENLEAESLEAARLTMASWCERMAAALRNVERQQADVPMYEKRRLNIDEAPAWLQREYAVLQERYKRCVQPDAVEDRKMILADLKDQGHPIVNIYGAIDQLEMLSYADE